MQAAEHRYFSYGGWLAAPALATFRLLIKPSAPRGALKGSDCLLQSLFKGWIAYSAAWQGRPLWELEPGRQKGEASFTLLKVLLIFILSVPFFFFVHREENSYLLRIPKPGYGLLDKEENCSYLSYHLAFIFV